MNLKFRAKDYKSDDSFESAEYEYFGNETEGWEIKRNGDSYLHLGPGYIPLKTLSCGVCSTDLDRRFLPFPLPQIIGHEVLAEGLGENQGKQFVVEINDTYEARGDKSPDVFCKEGIPTHSPERRVLGIDRLPGGFGPYILAPVHAAISLEGVSPKAAVLMEPFAAALQAILASPPKRGDHVAVLGPRRLGSLILAALASYRKTNQADFRITAITRHDHLVTLSKAMGADEVIDLRNTEVDNLKNQFDIVYDTTSTGTGFVSALKMAKREVHLKTTNGQVMAGLAHLTELVVDELTILPYSDKNVLFHWEKENRNNQNIFVFGGVSNTIKEKLKTQFIVFDGDATDAENILSSDVFSNRLPRFDLVIVSNPEELSLAIRPNPNHENSLVRPRGAILVDPSGVDKWPDDASLVAKFFADKKEIHSSRCGDFHMAISLLRENPEIAHALETNLISHRFSSDQLEEAYATAKDPSSIKVVVDFK
ncbi:alcohol dehydrogenase catalytic domain-containing protein [Leptospira sp. 2 VSF19]|uniref:Alcohol dehydrogenase catalytic domain-containing protein n=1 Tax=Leptospira soteropolitanensis TaxID=2950025 RepID=A0AAW5V7K0_9LEPT|nr:alcohol dehydrogenase catalytic domain-containing protein [Leptospira soteropolitanensis]MCW7491368.1 alcohol dehydrogenase catalytic domain-containing protein [Leptospira soteropolitanensis]MCW7498953.1 alcohol dehydrogenase catalytic domain-containing protein [Leptospira soteropolitanensis]MCW7521455.1 alcohol dehydrogenase catalytic domain-containing protein [Leptospira soteropolitanensis]MCW7525056.1 alcohol dehydrogenase catalytic domain-containing protein [Leptospira soteropolitanensis